MTYGYMRVSTDKQELNNQKQEILEFANSKKFGNVEFVEETISSRVKLDKRDLNGLIERLQSGDILITSELSRLGRSIMEVMRIFNILVEKKVNVYIIKNNIEILGESSVQSSVLIFAFSLASQIERELISQRTKQALAVRKQAGVKLGRQKGAKIKSKLDNREKEIRALLDKNISKASIAKMCDVGYTTLLHFIKSRGLDDKCITDKEVANG